MKRRFRFKFGLPKRLFPNRELKIYPIDFNLWFGRCPEFDIDSQVLILGFALWSFWMQVSKIESSKWAFYLDVKILGFGFFVRYD